MSNQNHFTKFRLLSITTSSFLLLWFFFDTNLAKTTLLKELGVQDSKVLAYILIPMILFFLMECLLEYSKEEEYKMQSGIQLLFVFAFSISSLVISYPKLIIDTFLHETTRYDLIIPVICAFFSSISAFFLRIFLEINVVFYRFRKTIMIKQVVTLIILSTLTLSCIAILWLLSLNTEIISFSLRYTLFCIIFFLIFFIMTPKQKLYDRAAMRWLSKKSEYLDRNVELSEYAASSDLKKEGPGPSQTKHKEVMKIINKTIDDSRKGLRPRFQFIKDIKFKHEDSHLVPEKMEDDDFVLRVKIYHKRTQEVVESTDVKFKYFESACKEIKVQDIGNDRKGYFTSIGLKAFYLQCYFEDDPDELLFRIVGLSPINEIQDFVNKRNPNINYKAENGWTPLLVASANGRFDVVDYFLKKAADPNLSNKLGAAPLSYAAWYGNKAICSLLLKYGADVNQRDMDGATPLIRATINGHNSIVKLLLENDANCQISDSRKQTALFYAEKHKYGDIRKLLINATGN
jgi:Ankyrin repeats (3 copies)/Ankyrin repeat